MRTNTRRILCLTAAVMSAAATAQTPLTLERVKASGSITVAYREASIPFSYLDDKAQPTGFGWEICGKIIDELRKATGRAVAFAMDTAATCGCCLRGLRHTPFKVLLRKRLYSPDSIEGSGERISGKP